MRTAPKPRTPLLPVSAMQITDNTNGRALNAPAVAREIAFLFGRELLTRLAAQRGAQP